MIEENNTLKSINNTAKYIQSLTSGESMRHYENQGVEEDIGSGDHTLIISHQMIIQSLRLVLVIAKLWVENKIIIE